MSMNVGMMACYDQARTVMARLYSDTDPKRPSLATKLSASCIAGFTAALFSLPFDMLKSRLQDQRPDSKGQASHPCVTVNSITVTAVTSIIVTVFMLV